MKAMILAAGRGRRLAPLTDSIPKPLIRIGDRALVERHLVALARAGITEVVMNISHLGHLIEQQLGDGRSFGVDITYSREPAEPLETGGGIVRALPLLGAEPFLVVSADILTDYPFEAARAGGLAHLVLIPNPPHNPHGDFGVQAAVVTRAAHNPYTYSGIGVFRPELFCNPPGTRFPVSRLLFEAARNRRLTGEVYSGTWFDVGAPERLAQAREALGTVTD